MFFFAKKYLPALVWASVIAFLSLTSSSNLPKLNWEFFTPDKVGHFTVYAILNMALIWAFIPTRSEKRHTHYLYATISASAFGVLMEYLQFYLTPDRQFEYPDMVANVLGALLGLAVMRRF
jgi:VanZ family protein